MVPDYAPRRLGEIVQQQRRTVGMAKGGRPSKNRVATKPDSPPSLAEAGIDKNLASRAWAAGRMNGEQPIQPRVGVASLEAAGDEIVGSVIGSIRTLLICCGGPLAGHGIGSVAPHTLGHLEAVVLALL